MSLTDRERACAQLAGRREEGGHSAGPEKGRRLALSWPGEGKRESAPLSAGRGRFCSAGLYKGRGRGRRGAAGCYVAVVVIANFPETEMRRNENKYT